MKKKLCPNCERYSYSAGAEPWICPYCCKNLDDVDPEPTGKEEN
jgi:hypothetical protein